MTRIAISTALVSIAISQTGVSAQTLSPIPAFEASTTTPAKNGATQAVHVSVQSWEIPSRNGVTHEIPLHGFYLAHLLSGDISATIDGQTTKQTSGSYWSVKAGATMQVKVLGEFAVLETIQTTKQ
jgi:quercetin dioxygenase-like cupin family protein